MDDLFVQMFQQSKAILCICPKCNALMRFGDLYLKTKTMPPKTWLDDYETSLRKVSEEESVFSSEERKIRDMAAECGRMQVPKIVKKSMDAKFAKLTYDPYDIKPLLHPVEFAIFDGMNGGNLNNIVLLSRKSSNPYIQNLQKSVADSVENKNYDWKITRVGIDGEIEFE